MNERKIVRDKIRHAHNKKLREEWEKKND